MPGWGRCAAAAVKRRKADRDDNNDRQWLDCRPTLRTLLLPNSGELPAQPHSPKRRRARKKEGGRRERAASELRHCLRQSSREFHWLGVRGPPIRYSCSGRGAAGREVTSVKGGSCGDNMAATQHHAPGMFVPRVFATNINHSFSWTLFIWRHFSVGLIWGMNVLSIDLTNQTR